MKIANTRLKKTFIIVISSIIIAIVIVILLSSPIGKYLGKKYGEKYTGRHITMGWVYVNPFTGYVHISDLKIYESLNPDSIKETDSVFFSAKGVSAKFAMLKFLSKLVEITEITLDQPKGIIIQNKKGLNFSDIIKKFTPEKPDTLRLSVQPGKPHSTSSPFHCSILGIKITGGEFTYREEISPINYFIREVNIESSGKYWNRDTMAVKFSLLSVPGNGSAKGNFTINFKTMDYRLAVVAQKFDLNIIEQYLKELTTNGSFSANLDADIKARGNFKDQEDLTLSGQLAVNDFHFGRTPENDYASFDKLVLAIIEVSPEDHKYLFDSVSISHPYFKYERYDYLDNLQIMIGKNGANITAAAADPAKFNLVIEIARYVKVLAKNFFQSQYKINRLAIYKGDLKYNDFAISEKFSAAINPLYIFADSIDKTRKWANVSFKSGIIPYGNINVTIRISPKDSTDFDIQYHLQKVPVAMFNPYLITYTSYPVDRGTIELNGVWKVRHGIIKSDNHLVIIDPRVIRRLKNKGTKWIPTRWIMSLIRDRGNVIDYQIPITGNLKNPKFHLHDVLVDLLENIFVKPATASYRMEVRNMETEIEESLTLKWQMRQSSLLPDQEKFVNKMVDFLIRNPEASISIHPMQYAEKEKEHIQFFEAKKKYFLLFKDKNALFLTKDDSLKVDKMSVKDSLFVQYLNKKAGGNKLFTIQEKCNKFIGSAIVDAKFIQLNKEREYAFMLDFKKKAVETRVKIYTGENNIPYNGFSFYKITYKGELPKSLIQAYRKMNELNDEVPRKKFENDRKKNKNAVSEIKPR